MTLFELAGWTVIVALFAGAGWLIDGERGAGLASLAAVVLAAGFLLRARRRAAREASDPVAWEPHAQWTLTRGQALAEAWSRRIVRTGAGLLVVFGLPGAIALAVRAAGAPPIAIAWRWGALVLAAVLAPVVVVILASPWRAVAALRNRERSARWTNGELSVRMPGGDWSAPRRLLQRTAWRDVMILRSDPGDDVVAMPMDVAARAGLARETEPHGPSFD